MAEMAHYAEASRITAAGWYRTSQFHRALTGPAGPACQRHAGRNTFDHAERHRRLHIGHGPTAWATASHREILDAVQGPRTATSAPACWPRTSREPVWRSPSRPTV